MGHRLYVYWNLHRHLYSVRVGGRVQQHASRVQLCDVTFVVGESGRQRVLQEQAKNVHAGLRGHACEEDGALSLRGWRRVIYDPYRFDRFVTFREKRPVTTAQKVVGIIVAGRARLYAKGLGFALT